MYDETFQTKVWPVLVSLFSSEVGPLFDGRFAYKVLPAMSQFPAAILQSQDGGGKNADTIDRNGWQGLITLRCLDTTLSGAWSLSQAVASVLPTIHHQLYDVRISILQPIEFPIEKISTGNVYTAGLLLNVSMFPKN